jgi:hypothetical protein
VAQACNPSYSRSRDQEDHSSKPAWTNIPQDPVSKKHITKRGWCSVSRCKSLVQAPGLQKKKKVRAENYKKITSKM